MHEILLKALRQRVSFQQVQFRPQERCNLVMQRLEIVLPDKFPDAYTLLARKRRVVKNVFTDCPYIKDLLDQTEQWTVKLSDLLGAVFETDLKPSGPIFFLFRKAVRSVPP